MFPNFPNFAQLKLDDKEEYERLVSMYPPFSDISFATLQIWWNLNDNLSLSTLNENLIIDYQLAGDEKNSGYCLIGNTQLESSIETIFARLKSNQLPVKLVHVPEFVVANIKESGNLLIEEELDYNEYILDSDALAKLEGSLHGKNRRRVKRFLREVEGRKVEIKELDLSSPEVKQELFDAIVSWEDDRQSDNDPEHGERQAIKKTLTHADELGIQHLGLFINDELHAIILYHQPHDKNYYILNHIKVNYSTPYIFDYITHHVANKASQENVAFLNMEMDLGIANLREHKQGLRPVDYFRKYTITPA